MIERKIFQTSVIALLSQRILLAVLAVACMTLARASAFGQTVGGVANAVPITGPKHSANVPEGYVITPFGYFHPSCVQQLAKGERLLADGRVQHSDGTAEKNVAVCNYQRYTPTGLPLTAGAATLPEVNGWIENANITTGSASTSYGALIATWTVPPQPFANDGQVLFLFPGFEDINNTQSILQPVLQWYQGQWAIASWNCCLSGITTSSPLVNVRPDDVIYGSITSSCSAGTLSCNSWNVLSLDMSTGESTTLNNTPSDAQVFNWAFGGVLEPYYVVACIDYPPSRRITFDRVTLFDQYLHKIADPIWTETFNSTEHPQCDYGVKTGPHEITLHF